jgi:hypothetical protein
MATFYAKNTGFLLCLASHGFIACGKNRVTLPGVTGKRAKSAFQSAWVETLNGSGTMFYCHTRECFSSGEHYMVGPLGRSVPCTCWQN